MSFSILKSELETALKVVANTVISGGNDLNAHYLFRARAGKVEVLSSSGRTFSSMEMKTLSSNGVDFRFTVEAKRIHCLLDALPKDSSLDLSLSGSEVQVKTDRGVNVFSSLDPAQFPYWDEIYLAAKPTARISAKRLNRAFSHARMFIYDQEAKAPQLCVAEFRKGFLYSTDQMAVSIVKVAGMEESSLRVYGKDVASVLHFLAQASESDVEILEHERAAFFRRGDGAVFGESVFASRFPEVPPDRDLESDRTWEVFLEEVQSNITFLTAGARWDDVTLRFKSKGQDLVLSMNAVGGKPLTQDLKAQHFALKEGALDLPEDGFSVSHVYLTRTLSDHSSTSVSLGVSRINKKGGWVRVKDNRDGDLYLTTIAWLKNA
jgi:DNA polymerase III sliding clamp (beta) subunit (PCNA family)